MNGRLILNLFSVIQWLNCISSKPPVFPKVFYLSAHLWLFLVRFDCLSTNFKVQIVTKAPLGGRVRAPYMGKPTKVHVKHSHIQLHWWLHQRFTGLKEMSCLDWTSELQVAKIKLNVEFSFSFLLLCFCSCHYWWWSEQTLETNNGVFW